MAEIPEKDHISGHDHLQRNRILQSTNPWHSHSFKADLKPFNIHNAFKYTLAFDTKPTFIKKDIHRASNDII